MRRFLLRGFDGFGLGFGFGFGLDLALEGFFFDFATPLRFTELTYKLSRRTMLFLCGCIPNRNFLANRHQLPRREFGARAGNARITSIPECTPVVLAPPRAGNRLFRRKRA